LEIEGVDPRWRKMLTFRPDFSPRKMEGNLVYEKLKKIRYIFSKNMQVPGK
jgi:hypothetical protein